MGRKILFITSDQQRYDSLGCNGNQIARTPVVDRLAGEGINYHRAYNQNTVCMPARSTMLTGQYVRTHGVVANGVPLPEDAPSIAAYLAEKAGYRTALLGKAHFEPGFDPERKWQETARAVRGDTGPWRGFERSIQVMHVAQVQDFPVAHYGRWLRENHPEHMHSFAPLLSAEGGGDNDAPETKNNPIPREWYHTDWVADLTIDWLESLDPDEDWFCWMSFPDPHHPWDPPESELHRVPWQDLDLPPGHPGSDEKIREVLAEKPAHWLAWYEGRFVNAEGGPMFFSPGSLTHDQIREVNAKTHVMNELIDEACGRVMKTVEAKGWLDDTDVFFTTDHGELQGDYGFIFKGPFHTDALMRLPFVWRPAPSASVTPADVTDPVGQVDLAPTFCAIAGVEPAEWMQGTALPTVNGEVGRERALCEWDSQFPGYGMHLRSVYRDGWLCTAYEKSTVGQPNGLEKVWGDNVLKSCGIEYDGSEGELYNVDDDPHQWHNLWDDPAYASTKADLVADLYDSLPTEVRHLEVESPRMTGYWPAAWPAEDGGPRRLQAVPDAALGAPDGRLTATSRSVFGGTMVVQREPGELYFHGATIEADSTAWLERIDPHTLEPTARIEGLPAGPWWPGGVLAHANGDLYVAQGRWCHRIAPDLTVSASRDLPRDRAYNSLLALPDGSLVMKDMSSDNASPSQLILLEPDGLTPIATHDLTEGSIARLSADGQLVAVVGMDSLFALQCNADGIEEVDRVRYRTQSGQTFGWDPVMDGAGSVWFLDNGAGTEAFSGSFIGHSSSSAPLHLVRTPWPPVPTGDVSLSEVCGEPGGIIANPPIIVEDQRIAIGYDSGHGKMTAWRWSGDDHALQPLWQRDQNHASHSLVYPGSGEVVTMDYDVSRGMDQCVVLDIESGTELARIDTGSPVQSVVFPCPGWERDFYVLTMTTLTRVAVT